MIRNEIKVNFEYRVDEQARYVAAGNALRTYKEKIRKQEAQQQAELRKQKEQQQERIRKQKEKKRIRVNKLERQKYLVKRFLRNAVQNVFEKIIPVVCFMIIEACLIIRQAGIKGLEQIGFKHDVKSALDTSNNIGALCLILIAIIAVIRIVKDKDFIYTIWNLFVDVLKSLGIWIGFLFLMYGIYYFTAESSAKEEAARELNNSKEEEVYEVLQEEIMQSQMVVSQYQRGDYANCTFTICVEESYIYVEPTDGGHMYVAMKDSRFVATGMEYLEEDGSLWYEFYLDSDRVLTSWVRESDIIFE